jgi:pyrimidine deaminase RibD-like protein
VIINEILTAPSNDPRAELDAILVDLCELAINNHEKDPEYYGLVASCVICPDGTRIYGINHEKDGLRVHAERDALDRCPNPGPDCLVVTTCSPCNTAKDPNHKERYGEDCQAMLDQYGIEHVYCGYKNPQEDPDSSIETQNPKIRELCKRFADTFLKENFADGRVKGKSRPGRVKRAGASCNGSVTDLRAKAKRASGERARMYHWCANMKSGKKNEDALDEKWTKKYKRSIDCSHPKGFSQRAHCQGRKKK